MKDYFLAEPLASLPCNPYGQGGVTLGCVVLVSDSSKEVFWMRELGDGTIQELNSTVQLKQVTSTGLSILSYLTLVNITNSKSARYWCEIEENNTAVGLKSQATTINSELGYLSLPLCPSFVVPVPFYSFENSLPPALEDDVAQTPPSNNYSSDGSNCPPQSQSSIRLWKLLAASLGIPVALTALVVILGSLLMCVCRSCCQKKKEEKPRNENSGNEFCFKTHINIVPRLGEMNYMDGKVGEFECSNNYNVISIHSSQLFILLVLLYNVIPIAFDIEEEPDHGHDVVNTLSQNAAEPWPKDAEDTLLEPTHTSFVARQPQVTAPSPSNLAGRANEAGTAPVCITVVHHVDTEVETNVVDNEDYEEPNSTTSTREMNGTNQLRQGKLCYQGLNANTQDYQGLYTPPTDSQRRSLFGGIHVTTQEHEYATPPA